MTESRWILLRMGNVSYKICRENQNIFIFSTFFRTSRRLTDVKKKISQNRTGHRWQYGACALHAEQLRLQTHAQNVQYLLLFYRKNGYTNTPQFYVTRTMPVFLLTQIAATVHNSWRQSTCNLMWYFLINLYKLQLPPFCSSLITSKQSQPWLSYIPAQSSSWDLQKLYKYFIQQ